MTAVNGSLTAMLASIDSETEKNLEVTLGSSGDDPGKILEIIAGLQNKGLNFPHFIATSSLGISTNGDVFTNYFRSFPDKDAKARYEFLHSTIAKIIEAAAKLIERSNNGDMSAKDLIRDKRHHRLVIQRGPGLAVENRTISNPQPVNQLGIY